MKTIAYFGWALFKLTTIEIHLELFYVQSFKASQGQDTK